MSLPTLITVSGVVRNSSGPLSGRLVFACNTPVRHGASGDVMAPHEIVVSVGATGAFTVQLPATNDPAWSPVGWAWDVRPHFVGWTAPFQTAIPYTAPGAALDFSSLVDMPDGDVTLYALVGHTHSGGGGAGDPAGTAAAAVAAHEAALDPHPQYLTATEGGALVTAHEAAANPHPIYLTQAEGDALYGGGGGGGSALSVRRGSMVTGDVVPQASVGVFAAVTGGPVMSIPAAVGDYVEFELTTFMYGATSSSTFLDLAVKTGGSLVRFLSTDTNTPAAEGAPALYPNPSTFRTYGPKFEFVVASGDLDAGSVNVVFAIKGAGAGTLYASAAYPLRWRAINHGPVTVV